MLNLGHTFGHAVEQVTGYIETHLSQEITVEEVAEATASNDMQKFQKPKLLTGCGKLMQTRKHIIFYNKTEKPFCVFSVFF